MISHVHSASFQLLPRNLREPSIILLHHNEVVKAHGTREVIDEPLRAGPGFDSIILSGAVNFGLSEKYINALRPQFSLNMFQLSHSRTQVVTECRRGTRLGLFNERTRGATQRRSPLIIRISRPLTAVTSQFPEVRQIPIEKEKK